ncbi:hypothetical protein AVEN_212755-1 [Araneus ventricosus]|uniref:Uncharacterized protein n=1 Tax=Araneus ventricosus TaxID=182803 RepID=A0A4Y2GWX1_ARAVE|nr:hypothetical protein AVEN_212755-1 [Araneus ventricosus]
MASRWQRRDLPCHSRLLDRMDLMHVTSHPPTRDLPVAAIEVERPSTAIVRKFGKGVCWLRTLPTKAHNDEVHPQIALL